VGNAAQVLATGGTTIAGVAVGACLTYWFGALNRRHQEAREDATRWHNARLQAYSELFQAVTEGWFLANRAEKSAEDGVVLARRLAAAYGQIQFVGSPEVADVADTLVQETIKEIEKGKGYDDERVTPLFEAFIETARKDLGHPSPKGR
jgi:hypothetical protein